MEDLNLTSIFDDRVREGLILRISALYPSHKAQWGNMNVFQMVKHNTYWNEWILGKGGHTNKQAWMGKLFGNMALRSMIKDEKPLDKNIPTSSQFKVKEQTGDLEAEKTKWIALTRAYDQFDNPAFIHDFFGKMTSGQIGVLVYKHSDHHLRQFGV
ncbi:DUF1569 domain-containing protein [Cyclobacterium jeungdonense]|uniref:DUF1569 domain-containing protein n=1 Tax=Cyclobacterium jeungdonense TaxID=708087 RepID=A0ABT8CC19_9BACT|nr:DUF1569 domain-containing protein [Cyclobacterium jeungdonense]MDN3689358.1 DUF1569 domain-containing protein [Cyclobacterium jeungdonense]